MVKHKKKKHSRRSSQPKSTQDQPRWSALSAAVLICFFLSGLAGLVYEVLWIRLFDKVIGSSPFAVASVLTVFMAGLAGGSFLASRTVDRISRPGQLLALYGLLECGIGIYGLLLPVLTTLIKPLYIWLYNYLFHHFWIYNIITFGICFLLLFLPVAFMGATLPILSRFYVRQLGNLGWRAGQLYGINTAGAAVGVMLAGFFLINHLGVWGTIISVAAVNFLVGIGCVFLGLKVPMPELIMAKKKDAKPGDHIPSTNESILTPEIKISLWIFAISGFSAMAYQVLWTRLLGLLIGPTTYSFTLVVATFIIGLALGNFIFGWWADRTRRVFNLLIATQIGAAFLALAASQFLGNSQFFFAKLIYEFREAFGHAMVYQSIVLFLILLGPTLLLGATFPLVSKMYTSSLFRIGRSIGHAYFINTVGAIIGSFSAGFILIPLLGKESGLTLVVAIQLATAFLAWGYLTIKTQPRPILRLTPVIVVLAAATVVIKYPSWNRRLLSYGRYQNLTSLKKDLVNTTWLDAIWRGPELLLKYETGREVVFYGDGVGGFTTVEKMIDSMGTVRYTMLISGKPDATSHDDASTQALLAHVPLLFHPNPRHIMVLGLGSGMTVGEVLHYPIDRVDVLEINNQVVKASAFFEPWNNRFISNPRTRMIIQDGRNHLALTKERYDVIISEPSNPWMAGMANLYTSEFFRTAKSRLRDGGIFMQWVHAGKMDWSTLAMIGRTFGEIFPRNLLMSSPIGGADYFLVGFNGREGFNIEVARKNMKFAKNSKIMTLPDVRLLYHLIITEDFNYMFEDGMRHSDNWPRLEFAAPRDIYGKGALLELEMVKRRRLSAEIKTVTAAINDLDSTLDLAEFTTSLYSFAFPPLDLSGAADEQKDRYYRLVKDFCSRRLVKDYAMFRDIPAKQVCSQIQIEHIHRHLKSSPRDAHAFHDLGIIYGLRGDLADSARAFKKSLSLEPHRTDTRYNLGKVYALLGDFDRAGKSLRKAIRANPSYAEAYFFLAELNLKQGEKYEAVKNLRAGLQFEENREARQLLRKLEIIR